MIIKNIYQLIKFVLTHPSNEGSRFNALLRIIRWQISSRLMSGFITIPFHNNTNLFAKKGMTSATSAWYCGLYEYEEMSFLSHNLNKGDYFVDIGANIGVYSILAASKGAKVISIEPVVSSFEILRKNIELNNFQDLIKAINIGISNKEEILNFSSNQDTLSHVVTSVDEKKGGIKVNSSSLDKTLKGIVPKFIKIDVEGFETNVIEGAEKTLQNKNLNGIIIELIGGGRYYGFDEDILHQKILSYGFNTYKYYPKTKKIISMNNKKNMKKNTIYLRNDFVLKIQ